MVMPAETTKPEVAQIFRKHEKIPYPEIEPLLNLLKNSTGGSEGEVLKAIGYATNSASDWRRSGQAPLHAKYGLLGLAVEMKVEAAMASRQKIARQFNHDELTMMFCYLSGVNFIVDEEKRRQLVAKVAAEFAR